MAELEDMISSILKDPGSMQMVSSLISGLGDKKDNTPAPSPLAGIDMQKITTLMQKMSGEPDERCKLLLALRPFVDSERQEKIDQSVKLLRLMSVAEEMGGIGLV